MIQRRRALSSLAASIACQGVAESTVHAALPDPLTQILASGKVMQRFGTAFDLSITVYELTYDTRFSAGYRSFLKRQNGLVFFFDVDDATKAGVSPALADMNTFFGVGNLDSDNDLFLLTPKMPFYNKNFIPFAPVIGLGGDFCTYVEVNRGRYAGQIMYADGEMSSAYRHTRIDGRSVDDLVEGFVKDTWFQPVAASFDALLADYAKMT